MMTPEILKSVDITKALKSRYLENKTFFSSNKKIHQLRIKGYSIAKNRFVARATFNYITAT